MAPRSNREVLTGGDKYRQKQSKKYGVEEVTFNKDDRHEYLTGFHKRKVERQKKARKFHEEQNRLAKIEERKKLREERQLEFESKIREMENAKNLDLTQVLREESNDEDEWEGFGEDNGVTGGQELKVDSDAEDEAGEQPLKGILQRKQIYTVEDTTQLGDAVVDRETTVTVENLENPYYANVGKSSLEIVALSNNVNLQKSEEVLDKSIQRAKKYAVVCGVAKPKPKPKSKKKFRYLTKSERRENNRKVKLSKLKSRNRDH